MALSTKQIRQNFERAVVFSRRSRWQRLLRKPVKTAGRFLLSRIFEKFGWTWKTRARLFWDEQIAVVFPESVSNTLLYQAFIEEGSTRFVLEHFKAGQVFVDVGAHIGYYALLASRLTGNGGSVHAFEPTPSTFEILAENCGYLGNVRLNNCGLWDKTDTLEIKDYGIGHSAFNAFYRDGELTETVYPVKAVRRRVPVIRLDDYCAENRVIPDMIKVDVETSEYYVLRGSKQILSKFKPLVIMEVGGGGKWVEGYNKSIKILADLGYRIYRYHDGDFQPYSFRFRDNYDYDNLFFIHPARKKL